MKSIKCEWIEETMHSDWDDHEGNKDVDHQAWRRQTMAYQVLPVKQIVIKVISAQSQYVLDALQNWLSQLFRCETTFKAKSMKGFNTTIPGKVHSCNPPILWVFSRFSGHDLIIEIKQSCNLQVVENKYQTEVPEREALQDWDLREVLKLIYWPIYISMVPQLYKTI